jgi:hypothetical protein
MNCYKQFGFTKSSCSKFRAVVLTELVFAVVSMSYGMDHTVDLLWPDHFTHVLSVFGLHLA